MKTRPPFFGICCQILQCRQQTGWRIFRSQPRRSETYFANVRCAFFHLTLSGHPSSSKKKRKIRYYGVADVCCHTQPVPRPMESTKLKTLRQKFSEPIRNTRSLTTSLLKRSFYPIFEILFRSRWSKTSKWETTSSHEFHISHQSSITERIVAQHKWPFNPRKLSQTWINMRITTLANYP